MVMNNASSLRVRLSILILALLALIGGAFTWVAHTEMRRALRAAGNERVGTAAAQLADLLSQTAAARTNESRRLASDPAVRHFVATGEGVDAALLALQGFAQRNPRVRIELNVVGAEGGGAQVSNGNVSIRQGAGQPDGVGDRLPEGVEALRVADGRVTYRTIAYVNAEHARGGVLSIDRPLSSGSGATLIEQLIGRGATVKFGNTQGNVWTDFSKSVASPPKTMAQAASSFVDAAGQRHLGMAVPVAGTPWSVWVEFSESYFMQPAAVLLRHMLPWTLGLICIGVVAVFVASTRIVAPLRHIADAADAIAGGDYSRRITHARQDEIGRVGSAFNVMADRVEAAHAQLEERVRDRTQELTRAREELDRFFSMSLDLLCIADLAGQFTRVNPAWEQVLGWTAADLTAVPYVDLVHPDDRTATMQESAKLALGGTTVSFENRYRHKDGTYRWLSWKAAANLELGWVYAAARDVTDEKGAARELRQSAAELTAVNRELEAFSYSVSHDLRAPLRTVDGFSQALLEDCGDRLGDAGQDHLRRIRAAAQHMGQLIDDLLKLARVTRAELNFSTVDLSALASRVFTRLSTADPNRIVDWRVQDALSVTADGRLLEVAITNLIENAWKFTRHQPAPRIEFGMRNGAGRPREYFVRDNGAGFDPAYASKLFHAFQRLHRAADFPGSGIGLATVQRIITRHGGQVRAEGAVGEGATFAFTLEPESHS